MDPWRAQRVACVISPTRVVATARSAARQAGPSRAGDNGAANGLVLV